MPNRMDLTAACRQATRSLIITPAPVACKYRRRNNAGGGIQPRRSTLWAVGAGMLYPVHAGWVSPAKSVGPL